MGFLRVALSGAFLAVILACVGCCVPKSAYDASAARGRSLAEQVRVQQTELKTAQARARDLEGRLSEADEQLAAFGERTGLDRAALASHERGAGSAVARPALSPEVSRRLAQLARKNPALHFDPETGVAKLDGDVVFAGGQDELTPPAVELLKDFAGALRGARSDDFKLMVVGHTDSRRLARPDSREEFQDNWRLSTARALAVAAELRRLGIDDKRIGVAGFGDQQPLVSNDSAENRRRNRRVEIFVVSPETPVVGWTETMPSAYRR